METFELPMVVVSGVDCDGGHLSAHINNCTLIVFPIKAKLPM